MTVNVDYCVIKQFTSTFAAFFFSVTGAVAPVKNVIVE